MSLKKTTIAALLAASGLVVSSASMAQGKPADIGFYIGGGIGQSKIKLDSTDFEGVSTDTKDTAFKVFGGYNFTPIFGAELMYADMGKATLTDAGDSGDYKASSFALAGTARFQLGSAFTIMGRLGGTQNKAKLNFPGFSGDKSKTDVYFGIGGQYDFNKNLGVRLDYDNFGKFGNEDDTGRAKVEMLSINAVYRF